MKDDELIADLQKRLKLALDGMLFAADCLALSGSNSAAEAVRLKVELIEKGNHEETSIQETAS